MTYARPLLLDLYCCEGGAARGYAAAGFDVHGVDLFRDYSRRRYPFPATRADALEHLAGLIDTGLIKQYAAVHASPPCQHASAGTRALRKQGKSEHPALIEPTRALLEATGLPYVIENVRGAALRDPVWLCGCMFGLSALDEDGVRLHMQRLRGFESNVPLVAPRPCDHRDHQHVAGSYGGARKQGATPAERRWNAKHLRHGGYVPAKHVQAALLGVEGMTVAGMYQCIPPAYAEHIGRALLAALEQPAAA